jgi:peptide/nickel transport system ATP-binding protein
MTALPLVDVKDLDFAYRQGDHWSQVLYKVNFSIARSEVFGLVGESGCGKSTVAYQLMGYRRENFRILNGSALFQSIDLATCDRAELDQLRGNRISLVPQNPTTALSPGMRVGRQIVEVLQFHDAYPGKEAERCEELFRLVGLPDPKNIGQRYPHQLSGGQQQRVCIAMALACKPDLLVLDEPTTGLDVTTQEQIIELLADLKTRLGMSMLYVTHDLGLLAQIADRVGVMYAGRMVEIASTRELFASPRHPYTRGLIASIPQIDRVRRRTGVILRGLLRRDQLPPGCPFQPRCDYADASCAIKPQELESAGAGHEVACQYWRDIAGRSPSSREIQTEDIRSIRKEPLLRLDALRLGYGSPNTWLRAGSKRLADVVADLSFAILEGETFALVGESGSGKSTVARAVSGLLAPKDGEIRFEGEVLPSTVQNREPELRRRIQYIFQNPDASLNPRARIASILARPLELFTDLDRAAIEAKVASALEDVRLDSSYAARYPDQLSGGERQRVAIARALVADPKLLLCDEILSALDVSVQANVLSLLQRLRGEHNLTMLFISHDLAVVRSLADRVGVLFRGRLMEVGPVEDIFKPPFHPYTYELLMAVPSINRIGAARSRRKADRVAKGTSGCAFAGRCQWQMGSVCETQPPPARQVSPEHVIRCHIPLDDLMERERGDLRHLEARPVELSGEAR